jgi:menaquinone-dependent protoporphyrinogen oxidase
MANILIVYGTSHGHTEKVVTRISRGLGGAGHRVTVWKGDEVAANGSIGEFDAFLVAGSVIFGWHQRYLEAFVRRNLGRLNAAPSGFVSVCGALAGTWSHGPAEARRYITAFLARTGWRPGLTRSFAGGLPYTRYGFFTRWLMYFISRATGRPTDTTRDWDLTDWEAVDLFTAEVGARIGQPATAGR